MISCLDLYVIELDNDSAFCTLRFVSYSLLIGMRVNTETIYLKLIPKNLMTTLVLFTKI